MESLVVMVGVKPRQAAKLAALLNSQLLKIMNLFRQSIQTVASRRNFRLRVSDVIPKYVTLIVD